MKCSLPACRDEAVFRVTEVRNRALVGGDIHFCDGHGKSFLESYRQESRVGVGPHFQRAGFACFELELMVADYKNHTEAIALREVGSSRVLIFSTGYVEIGTLYYAVQDSKYKPWMLHVGIANVAKHFGGTLSHVLVDDRQPDGAFITHFVILHAGKEVRFQIRASDGVALAILNNLPFLVANKLLGAI